MNNLPYTAGSVSIPAGSNIATGSGVVWTDARVQPWGFLAVPSTGLMFWIETIDSATQITLAFANSGAAIVDEPYIVLSFPSEMQDSLNIQAIRAFLATANIVIYRTTVPTAGDGVDGTACIVADGINPITVWTKVAGAWTQGAFAFSSAGISDATTVGKALITAADEAAARDAIDLGNSSTLDVGTTAGTVAAGDDSRFTVFVADRAALKALNTTGATSAYLQEAGREGPFFWRIGDYSAKIAADTVEGVYVKADAVAATAGAWIRSFVGRIAPSWFGAAGDGATDDTTAVTAALAAGTEIDLRGRTYIVTALVVPDAVTIFGPGTIKRKVGAYSTNFMTLGNNVVLDGIAVDANKAGDTGSSFGVEVNGKTGVVLRRSTVKNSTLHNIDVRGPSSNFSVTDCDISGAKTDGISISQCSQVDISHNNVSSNG